MQIFTVNMRCRCYSFFVVFRTINICVDTCACDISSQVIVTSRNDVLPIYNRIEFEISETDLVVTNLVVMVLYDGFYEPAPQGLEVPQWIVPSSCNHRNKNQAPVKKFS